MTDPKEAPAPATEDKLAEIGTAIATMSQPDIRRIYNFVESLVIEPPATNVIEAVRRVMRDLPAIGKDEHAAPEQGGYAYRGIAAITKHVQPLFAKHGVVLSPNRIEHRERIEISVRNKPWTDTELSIVYRCYGPGGVDDYIEIEVPSVGRDNSDKGSNKAMTQAYKYALTQLLCIADAKDDNDGTTDEADDRSDPERDLATRPQIDNVRALVRQLRALDIETSTPTDEGGVLVLGVPILAMNTDGELSAVITQNACDALAATLRARLAEAQPTETVGAAPIEADGGEEDDGVPPLGRCSCGEPAIGLWSSEPFCGEHAPADVAPDEGEQDGGE